MELKVISSGSKGNAYILENFDEALLIECGVRFEDIKKALNFNLSKVKGCILTHEHGDHAKSAKDLMDNGVEVWASYGTHKALGTLNHHRAKCIPYQTATKVDVPIGGFTINPFDVLHDAAEPFGFHIHHLETGNVLFLTDLIFCAYNFKNLNNIIIEANYDEEIARKKLTDMEFLRNRIIKNHMSIDTCLKTLKAHDLSQVNNIVLVHLSDSNSNAYEFQNRVAAATLKKTFVADAGLQINFNITPF